MQLRTIANNPVRQQQQQQQQQQLCNPIETVHRLLDGVNVSHKWSLANVLARFMGVPFAGHVRGCVGCSSEQYASCNQQLQAPDAGSATEALHWLRQLWYKQCIQTGALQGFLASCRDVTKHPDLQEQMPEQLKLKTIIAYLTEDIAQDRHTKNITGHWCERLGLIDSTGVDIEYTKNESLEITPNAVLVCPAIKWVLDLLMLLLDFLLTLIDLVGEIVASILGLGDYTKQDLYHWQHISKDCCAHVVYAA